MSSTLGRSTRAGASLMGSTASSDAEQRVVWSNCRFRHTRCKFPPLSCCGFGSWDSRHIKSNVLCQPLFDRTLGPLDRECGQALFSSAQTQLVINSCHSPSSSLRYSLARQESSSISATTNSDSMRCCLEIETTFSSLFLNGGKLGGRQGGCCELGHCEMRLENESSVSFSQCLCCGSCGIVCADRFLCWLLLPTLSAPTWLLTQSCRVTVSGQGATMLEGLAQVS